MAQYWYDTEFIADEKTIDLISIGIVCEDGRELYMQSTEFDPTKASEWVCENVFPHLVMCPHVQTGRIGVNLWIGDHKKGQCTFIEPSHRDLITRVGVYADCPWRRRDQMKNELLHFMDIKTYGEPVLWGYYSAYDHVAFCQLFGTMMELPKGFPMYTRDIKQLCVSVGNPRLPEQGKGSHNALADARWNKNAYEFLLNYTGEPENVLHESHDY